MTTLELLKFIQAKQLTEIYPNLCIALRISATLPVTVASAKTSFSKLKLLKMYLRSTMAQERLSGLAVSVFTHYFVFTMRLVVRFHTMMSLMTLQRGRPEGLHCNP